jgi:uncharacterized membrane protein
MAFFSEGAPEGALSWLSAGLDPLCAAAATLIGYIGVAVMAYGSLKSAYLFFRSRFGRDDALPLIRVDLGKHLALGLEFLVGKDIIESIVHPTWDDLGKLGAIIALRTVLQIFLAREIREVEEEIARHKHARELSKPAP